MKASTRKALTLGAIGLAALAWSGCEGKKQTELVAGISTQVRVPKDLKTIRVDVKLGGDIVKCDSYRVYDGKVQLPRTLGTLPITADNRGTPITITVAGYSEERLEATPIDQFADCAGTPIKLGVDPSKGRILRSSRQTYSPDKILFLPMPLSFACFDRVDCAEQETCKAGRCVSSDTDSSKLAELRDDMVNGAASTCFSGDLCVNPGASLPVRTIDAATCVYAHAPSLPPLQGQPTFPKDGDGLNVRAVFDGGQLTEVLDLDPEEGFFIPDASKPQQFQLAPGLCDMVKGIDEKGRATPHRISGLVTSGVCRSKTQRQPICDKEANRAMTGNAEGNVTPQAGACQTFELKPTPNALVVVLDASQRLSEFYKDTTVSRTLSLSLADPAFEATQLGLKVFPQAIDCNNRVFGTLDVAMQPALKAQTAIAGKIAEFVSGKVALEPLATPLKTDATLEAAYAKLAEPAFASFSRKGVLIIGNRDFAATKCTAGTKLVDVAKRSKVLTYALLLGDQTSPADPELTEAAADPSANLKLYDARKEQARGSDAFSQVTRDLTSCLYDWPAGKALDDKAVVSFYDPLKKQTITVQPSAGCTDRTGWTAEGGKVRFCPSACDDLVSRLKDRADAALLQGQTATPVPIFGALNCGAPTGAAASPAPTTPPTSTPPQPDAGPTPTDAGTDAGIRDGG